MGTREIKVEPKEFYRPVHPRTLEEYQKAGQTYKYTADEQGEQKKWDYYRYADDTYRFNVQVLRLSRVLDERDGNEYLTRVWNVSGKSEIGNTKPFVKMDNIDTYKVPIVKQQIVQATGGQSLKTTPGNQISTEIRFLTPFTVDNVIEAMKDTMPPHSLRFMKLTARRQSGDGAMGVEKKYFIAWLLAPYEILEEFIRSRTRSASSLGEYTLDKYKDRMSEFQYESLNKIITNSNLITADMDDKRMRELEEQSLRDKGLKIPDASEKVVVKVKKNDGKSVEETEGRKTF